MNIAGDQVSALLKVANRRVLVVAPFIRSEALSRIFEAISDGVRTTVVTRWRLSELLSGASDLDVYDVIRDMGADLLLRSDLHAKLFVADNACLVGSANVTLTAFGWRQPANFELLVPVGRDEDCIKEFESQLMAGAVPVTTALRDELARALSRVSNIRATVPSVDMVGDAYGVFSAAWIPSVRNPEDLYPVYRGQSKEGLPLLQAMQAELAQIGVPSELNEEEFRAWVAGTILQTRFFSTVLRHFEGHKDLSEGNVMEIIRDVSDDPESRSARDVLEIAGRWLRYFLRREYLEETHTKKLIEGKSVR